MPDKLLGVNRVVVEVVTKCLLLCICCVRSLWQVAKF